MSDHRVYTLWASLKEEAAPWMLAAEDEYAWEGDPDRCEKAFQDARDLADRNEWEYREITLRVVYEEIAKSFEAGEIAARVEETDAAAADPSPSCPADPKEQTER